MSDTPEAMSNPAYPPEDDAREGNAPSANPEGNEALSAADIAAHYEQDDVNIWALARWAIAIAVGGAIFGGALWTLLGIWSDNPVTLVPQVAPAAVTAPAVPGPGLDAVPELTLDERLQLEDQRLHTYGWVDRDNGVVRIPIDEAMRLLVERGVPAREGAVPTFGLAPAYQLDSSGGTHAAGAGAGEELDQEAGDD